jgi:hypothetical protein
MDLKINWVANVWTQRDQRGIETLEVSNLQQRTAPCGCRDHFVCLSKRPRDRFLHQHMDAGVEQAKSNSAMRLGWNRKTDSIDAADQFAPIRRPVHFSFCGNRLRSFFIEVANGDKLRQSFRGKIRMDSRMLSAEMTYADHCGTERQGFMFPVMISVGSDQWPVASGQ